MLNVDQTYGFVIRTDGSFQAFAGGVDVGALAKAEAGAGDGKMAYPFKARASTADKDREDETVLQKGLNFAPFNEHGEFNWHHMSHAVVGLPVGRKSWFEEAGWMVEGEMIKGMPITPGYDTDMVIKQHNTFKKAGYQRGLCCSIEGKVTQRSKCGKYVQKADVYNIALTFRPQNPNCSVNMLAKAFNGTTPLIEGDDFYKALTAQAAAAFTKEDLEGGASKEEDRKKVAKELVSRQMKKGMPRLEAERAVYKYLWEKQAFLRGA